MALQCIHVMDDETIRARLYDLPRLLDLRAAIRLVESRAEPRADVIRQPTGGSASRQGVLAGSFNPLTIAHTGLAAAALEAGAIDSVVFTLSTHTIDKETVSGAALEDRLLVLELAAEQDARLGVILVNRGLYVEQAELLRAGQPDLSELVFLVGHDKMVQILDPHYYDDRDASLARLFEVARFLVAPRGADGPAELADLLARPENRPYAATIRSLDLPTSLRNVASSQIRQAVPSGALVPERLPPAARVFVEEAGAYHGREPNHSSVDRYRLRLALLDALEVTHATNPRAVDFRSLFVRARDERF